MLVPFPLLVDARLRQILIKGVEVKGPQIGKLDVPYRRDDTIQVVSIAAEGLGR